MTVRFGLLSTACLAILYCTPDGAQAIQPPRLPELPDFDVRAQGVQGSGFTDAETRRRRDAIVRLKSRVPDVHVDWDELTGTPKWIVSRRGFLTGPQGQGGAVAEATTRGYRANEPHRAAKAFMNEHAALLGHDASALASAQVVREFTGAHNQLHTVAWQQQVDGCPVFGGVLVAHTTRHGELVSLSDRFIPNPEEAAAQGHPRRIAGAGPETAAEDAIANAALNIGEELRPNEVKRLPITTPGPHGFQSYAGPALQGVAYARLVWLPRDRSTLRLCWEVILTSRKRGEMFRVLIDTETRDVMLRQGLTRYVEPATYRVFTSDSPTPFSPGHLSPSTNQPCPPCGKDASDNCLDWFADCRQLVTLSALSPVASPNGWINDSGNETRGNNVDAYVDWNNDDLPDQTRPQGLPYRVFDFPLDLSQEPEAYSSAAVVQLFYWCNWMHDKLYDLGFTEAAGNFQDDNFGRGGLGSDSLLAEAQDGASTNNSRFFSTPDGIRPRLEIYLFDGTTPKRDGDFDAEVVLHEYTHGLSSRLVGVGTGTNALQPQGLAEGWSDFYPLALLSEPGDDLNGTYPIGAYLALREPSYLENYYYGVRRYPYSTDFSRNPLTFKDIDPLQASNHVGVPRNPMTSNNPAYPPNAVYSLGELWCVTLWEMRANLINQYGFADGNQLALQLVTEGMILTPAEPTFLQARDAILLADRVGYGGVHFYDIWAAFAKRGLGYSATCPPSWTSTGVREAFDVPDNLSVTPQTGFVASGSAGGPFQPAAQTYLLTNFWTNEVVWSVINTSAWLTVSQTGGTLAPAGPATEMTVSINAAGNSLPVGLYTNTVLLLSLGTGAQLALPFILRIEQPDFFTELFTTNTIGGDPDPSGYTIGGGPRGNPNPNDLDYQTFTFTPDGSPSYYAVCREPAANFLTDPYGGTTVPLADDSNAAIGILDEKRVSLYGTSSGVLFIGSNGYITFGSGDSEHEATLSNHFNRLRISALFDDLNPAAGGNVSWKQLSNRVAVTFSNVPEYNATQSNSFQIELFFDGTIRLTYLGIAAHDGLIGLSSGTGVPAGFFESDFTRYGGCTEPLALTAPVSATEGDGFLAGAGQVRILTPVATNLLVQLASGDTSEVLIPVSVVAIPAGRTQAPFDLWITDDSILDGTRLVPITAWANGYRRATNFLTIFDNESATLSLSLPTNAIEGIGSVRGTVTASALPATDVQVKLSAGYTDKIQVPEFVVIPAGKTSAVFDVTVMDDALIDGPQSVTVTAHVENWVDGTATLTIQDNEAPILRVSLPAVTSESDGLLPGAGVVRLSGTLLTNLVVSLASDRPALLAVPSAVTIPAGQISAAFDLAITDNPGTNPPELVTVTATFAGFTNGSATLIVQDDETPAAPINPSPPNWATEVPVYRNLYWSIPERELIVNGGFETGDFTGWTRENSGAGNLYINDGTYDPVSVDGPLPPLSQTYSVITDQTGPSKHTLYQDITVPSGARSVILRWFHRLRNHAGIYATNQQFRVEIRDVMNNVLAVAYTTSPSEPLFTDWIQHLYDLAAFKGRNIRVAFVEEDRLGYFNVHLDDVSVVIGSPDAVVYNVYFGTSATPGPDQLLGTTTNLNWDLSQLLPLTTYYWQVVAHRLGQSSSPVWQFTTRGVDHFEWSAVASPQQQGQPFNVAVTARDELNTVVTNFTGPVALSARIEAPELAVGDGTNLSSYPMAASSDDARSQVIYSANELGGPQRFTALALEVAAAPGQSLTNWTIRMKHTPLDLYTQAGWECEGWTVVYQHNETIRDDPWVYFVFDTPFDYDGTDNLMIDFSFNNSSVSSDGLCFVSPTAEARALNGRSDGQHGNPRNWCGSTPAAQMTNEVPKLRLTPFKPPVVISPMVSGTFEDGVWVGQIAVTDAASGVTLCADDQNGKWGRSGPFTVLPDNALRLVEFQWLGADFQIGFTSVAGRNYRVECSGALSATGVWSPVPNAENLLGTGDVIRVTDINAASHPTRFYRVSVLP